MPNYANEGDKVRMKDGSMAIVRGGRLVALDSAASGGQTRAGIKPTPRAETFLNDLSTQAQAAQETGRVYKRAAPAVERLQTGPFRGRFLDIALPNEKNDNWLSSFGDAIGSSVIGIPAKLLGMVDDQDVDDYQKIQAAKSANVLTRQLLQKGPQTESDAARLGMTEVSPSKTVEVNRDIINAGIEVTKRARARSVFFSQWANKYGLQGKNERGRTAEQVWQGWGDKITAQLFPQSETARPRIRKVR